MNLESIIVPCSNCQNKFSVCPDCLRKLLLEKEINQVIIYSNCLCLYQKRCLNLKAFLLYIVTLTMYGQSRDCQPAQYFIPSDQAHQAFCPWTSPGREY